MKLTKKLESYVRFANFAIEHGIEPMELAKLVQLCHRRISVQTQLSNGTERKNGKEIEAKLRGQIQILGKTLGFDVTFDALPPTVKKDGREVFLPLN